MRRDKHKHTRRAVRFYRVHYGFREPFKVLFDGNFLHALQLANRAEPQEVISKLLGGQVRPFVTACVLNELRSLGTDFAATHKLAKKACYTTACGHEGGAVAPCECLLSCVGESNKDHWWIASQDTGLRRAVQALPAGATLFASGNGVHLDKPSRMQQATVAEEQTRSLQPSEAELRSEALKQLPELAKAAPDKSLFRRNRAKGPNPLSMKRKQKQPAAGAGSAVSAAEQPTKRKRRRTKEGQPASAAPEPGC